MGALVFLIVAVFAISQTESVDSATLPANLTEQQMAYVDDIDEGDIGQLFGKTPTIKLKSIVVIVEEPAVVQVKIDCYAETELVRDLTVPYGQRSYIRADGSFCTPVE